MELTKELLDRCRNGLAVAYGPDGNGMVLDNEPADIYSGDLAELIAAAAEGIRLREEVAAAERRVKVMEMALLAAARQLRCHNWGRDRCPALDVTFSQSDENTHTCPAGLIRWAEAEIAKEVEG